MSGPANSLFLRLEAEVSWGRGLRRTDLRADVRFSRLKHGARAAQRIEQQRLVRFISDRAHEALWRKR